MPIIDQLRDVLVVRVVYDGPPFSGKTTTLRALASGLGVGVSTPEERDGRTVFFDWVDYVGGLFEGRRIRCQIVSVPGQDEYASRRHELLDAADVVVMVADSRADKVGGALELLRGVVEMCRRKDPPVGFVLQANKTDTPESLSREVLQAKLASIAPGAIVETVATTGQGVREAFVFGVRLALDRVRALAVSGRLPKGRPDVDSAQDLLALLQQRCPVAPSPKTPELAPGHSLIDALDDLAPQQAPPPPEVLHHEHVFVPDPMIPGGFIWPPVNGRSLLHEVAQLGLSPRPTTSGDWWASEGDWQCHSSSRAIFDDVDDGRHALIDWARLHALHSEKLSEGRALVLADAGGGKTRLWQLVRRADTLRSRVLAKADTCDARELATELHEAATALLRARELLCSAALQLPCCLSTVATSTLGQPIYAGLMPEIPGGGDEELDGEHLLDRELTPLIRLFAFDRDDFSELTHAFGHWRQREPGVASNTLASIGSRGEWS